SGPHSLYLSLFDLGDYVLDSAVFLDNLRVFKTTSAGVCAGSAPRRAGRFVPPPAAGKAPFPDCPPYGVIGSRGSGENNPKDSSWGEGLGPPPDALAIALGQH